MSQNNALNWLSTRVDSLLSSLSSSPFNLSLRTIRNRSSRLDSTSNSDSNTEEDTRRLSSAVERCWRRWRWRWSRSARSTHSGHSARPTRPHFTHAHSHANGGPNNGPNSQTHSHSDAEIASSPASHYPLLFCSNNLCRDSRMASIVNGYNSANHINREKDRNVLAAMMSIIVIATLATALAQPKWFSISGGVCTRRYIGLQEFFYPTIFSGDKHLTKNKEVVTNNESERTASNLLYGSANAITNAKMCVTQEIVTLQRTIIALCFFAILFNLIQFFMDTMGTHKKWVNALRQHALGNIIGVLFCVVIVGLSYLVSNLLEKEQQRLVERHDSHQLQHIEVKFEISYYLVTLSGLLAIIAAACNLLKRPTHYLIESSVPHWSDHMEPYVNHFDDEVSSSSANNSPNRLNASTFGIPVALQPQSSLLFPPPAYTP